MDEIFLRSVAIRPFCSISSSSHRSRALLLSRFQCKSNRMPRSLRQRVWKVQLLGAGRLCALASRSSPQFSASRGGARGRLLMFRCQCSELPHCAENRTRSASPKSFASVISLGDCELIRRDCRERERPLIEERQRLDGKANQVRCAALAATGPLSTHHT